VASGRDQVSHPSAPDVVAAFALRGGPRRIEPVAGAWSHRLYRLETSAGVYAVKQMTNPWGDPHWRSWLAEAWAFELEAFDAGISMPRPIPAIDGGCLADVQSEDGRHIVPVRVHDWVAAAPCPVEPVDQYVAERLGQDLATMHALEHVPQRWDVFPQPSRDGLDHWPVALERLREIDPGLAEVAADISPWIDLVGEMFDAANTDFRGEPMSHGDVDQKNVLLTSDRPVLCDWDVAAPWNRRAELARTAMSLACWERPEVARWTIAAYTGAGGDDGTALESEHLAVDLAISVAWLVFCLERATGLRPADQHRQQESRMAIPGLLARLPRQVATALNVRNWISQQ
jgi:Ser/Thr protein kinase RdoA (MazF antagonist)